MDRGDGADLFRGSIHLCQQVIRAVESPCIHFFLGDNDDLCMYADPGYIIRLGTPSEIVNWGREPEGQLVPVDTDLPQPDKFFTLLTDVLVGTEGFPDNVMGTIQLLSLIRRELLKRIGSQCPNYDYADTLSDLDVELVGVRLFGRDWIGKIMVRATLAGGVEGTSTVSFSPDLVLMERNDFTFWHAIENLARSVSKLIVEWREVACADRPGKGA